jgi:hypothetical protein
MFGCQQWRALFLGTKLPFLLYLGFQLRDFHVSSHRALSTDELQRISFWSILAYYKGHFAWRTEYLFVCISVSNRGILLNFTTTISTHALQTKYGYLPSVSNEGYFARAMAQAVSRRPLTAEALVRSRVSPHGICGGQSGTGTGFSASTSVFPCQFHSIGAPLHGKMEEMNRLYHRVAQ